MAVPPKDRFDYVMKTSTINRVVRCLALVTALSLAACGGDGVEGGKSNYVVNSQPSGIWSGTDMVTGLAILAMVDEPGRFHIIRADGAQFVGTALTSGDGMVASVDGVTELGKSFPDGSTHGTGTLNGNVSPGKEIDIDAQFTTDAGTAAHILAALKFDSAYYESSSLAILAGNYADVVTGTVVSINSDGYIFAQDAITGCVVNGQAGIISGYYNMYRVQVSYASCQGTAAALNGMTFTGFGILGDTVSPQELIAGVTGNSDGVGKYSIIYALKRLSPGSP
ncbi:MAG TPA: hypothetical protein VI653_14505 [Steroidobacteraceae bacterium]